MENKPVVTLAEAAAVINRKKTTLINWVAKGHLVPVGTRAGRHGGLKAKTYRMADVRAVAARMAANPLYRSNRAARERPGPTMAELEAMIAERLAAAPKWFKKEQRLRDARSAAEQFEARLKRILVHDPRR